MNKLILLIKNSIGGGITRVIITSLLATLACTGIIYAATTVGNNISTTGTITGSGANTLYGATSIGGALTATSTLNVSGLTTLGSASTTLLSVANNFYVTGSSTLKDLIIDATSTQAFLVRGGNNSGNILTVDTTVGDVVLPLNIISQLDIYTEGDTDFDATNSPNGHWFVYWRNYLLTGNGGGQSLVFDISNPSDPRLVSQITAQKGYCDDLGDMLVCIDSDSDDLYIYDLNNMTDWTPIYSYAPGSTAGRDISGVTVNDANDTHAVKCGGKYCYTSKYDSGSVLLKWEIHKDNLGRAVARQTDVIPMYDVHDLEIVGNYLHIINSYDATGGSVDNNSYSIYTVDGFAQVGTFTNGNLAGTAAAEDAMAGLSSLCTNGKFTALMAFGKNEGVSEGGNCITIMDAENPTAIAYKSHICDDARYDQFDHCTWIDNNQILVSGETSSGIVAVFQVTNGGATITEKAYYSSANKFAVGTAPANHIVIGRHLYEVSNTNSLQKAQLVTYKLNGITTPTLDAGQIRGNDLYLAGELNVGRQANFGTGIAIGGSGLYSSGGASIDNGLILTDDDAVPMIIYGYDDITGSLQFSDGSLRLGGHQTDYMSLGWDNSAQTGTLKIFQGTAGAKFNLINKDTTFASFNGSAGYIRALTITQNDIGFSSNKTATAAEWIGAMLYLSGASAGVNLTIPTAASIKNTLPYCSTGTTIETKIFNYDTADTITLVSNAGISGYGDNTIGPGEFGVFVTQFADAACNTAYVNTVSIVDVQIDAVTW